MSWCTHEQYLGQFFLLAPPGADRSSNSRRRSSASLRLSSASLRLRSASRRGSPPKGPVEVCFVKVGRVNVDVGGGGAAGAGAEELPQAPAVPPAHAPLVAEGTVPFPCNY